MIEVKKAVITRAASTDMYADMPTMKALALVADKVGFDPVYASIVYGDTKRIASWLSGMPGYSGPTLEYDVECDLAAYNAMTIEAERYGRRYRLTDIGGETKYVKISDGGGRDLRQEARDNIEADVLKLEGSSDLSTVLKNLYRYAFAKAKSDASVAAIYGIASEGKPAEPEPEPHEAAAPTVEPVQQIVREKVIVQEKEPVLETMLREAMMKTLVDINIDDLAEKLKQRLTEEFGFEPVRHVVKVAEFERDVNKVVHHEFDTVLHWVANDVPIYMYGGAGSGKNVLAEQVAEALGMDFYFMNSVTDEFKITGFIDAYGVYHETEFYRAFKNGGLFFLDELDASAPEVLVCLNAAIANRYFTFPTGEVRANENFRVIAAGNTLGTGADASYTGRMQLDAASLNRFVVVEIDYDPAIDMLCAGGDSDLVEFIGKFRKVVKDCGLPVVASYRNISQIRIACEKLKVEKALRQCLCKEMNQDDINIVAERLSELKGNRYYDGFKRVKSIIG